MMELQKLRDELRVGWRRGWWGRFKGNRWIRENTAIARRGNRNPEIFLLIQAAAENQIDIIAEIYRRNGGKIVRQADQEVLRQALDAKILHPHFAAIVYLLLTQNKDLCDATLHPSSVRNIRHEDRTVLEEAIVTRNLAMAKVVIENCQNPKTLAETKLIRKTSPESPLNLAILYNQFYVVEELLQKCDAETLNAKINGKTALMNVVDKMVELRDSQDSRRDEFEANKDMFRLLASDKKIDVLALNRDGRNIARTLIAHKKDDEVIWLIENRPELIFAKDENFSDMMEYAIFRKSYAIIEYLIDKGFVRKDTEDKDGGVSCFNWMAIGEDRNFQQILEKVIPKEIREDFKDLSVSKIVLGLAYSGHDLGWGDDTTLPQFISNFLETMPQSKEVEFMKPLLNIINSGGLHKISEDKFVKVVPMNFYDHIAYAIIECDKDQVPQFVTYCDGNCILSPDTDSKYAMGNVTFEIDDEKLRWNGIRNNLNSLENLIKRSILEYDENSVRNIFANFVVCDEYNKPIIADNNPVYTVPQKRGNCAFKSMNIALRDLMAKNNMEFVIEKHIQPDDEGELEIGGNGYKVFKDFRNSLIDHALVYVLNCAEGHDSAELREEARMFLQKNILPKVQAKIISKVESGESQKLARHSEIQEAVQNVLGMKTTGDLAPSSVEVAFATEDDKSNYV